MHCCNCMKKCKMLGWCMTAPRGQGQFQYGNSTGTVPRAGFGKMFDLEFYTKSCLRVLQRTNIIDKSIKTYCKCLKNAKKPGYCSTVPLSQGPFHYGYRLVILLGLFFSSSSLQLLPKIAWECGKKIIFVLKIFKVAASAWKIRPGVVPPW